MNKTPARRQTHPPAKPPSRLLLALEGRAVFEWASCALSWPWLKKAPRGDGHPVLVLPGLIAGDASTWPLRRLLGELGYDAHAWELGLNVGPRGDTVPKLIRRVRQIHKRAGRPLSLVGWSLGGAMARALAARMPGQVRNVISLGSPVHPQPKATNAWRVFEMVSGWSVEDPELHALASKHPPMPNTSIFSKSDGIVSWRASVAPESPSSENIEVTGSHLGLGVNPLVLWAIADRLSQPEGAWQPFDRATLLRRLIYRRPQQFRLAELL